jgi:hypothetical protein
MERLFERETRFGTCQGHGSFTAHAACRVLQQNLFAPGSSDGRLHDFIGPLLCRNRQRQQGCERKRKKSDAHGISFPKNHPESITVKIRFYPKEKT